MILGLYLVRRLAATFGAILAVFFGVVVLLDVVENVRLYGGGDVPFGRLLWLALLRTPSALYDILSLMTILASIALFLGLARASELVVIRAAGRSALRTMLEPAVAVWLAGALAVAALNPLSAASIRAHQQESRALAFPGVETAIVIDDQAIWLRQADTDGQTVLRAEELAPDGTTFLRVSFLRFDAQSGMPWQRIEAARATLGDGVWTLGDVKIWTLSALNPEREAERRTQMTLATDLTPARVRDTFFRTDTVSIWALPAYIRALDRAGLSSRLHRAYLQAELARPLMMTAMLLLGAVLMFRHQRAGGTGARVLIAILAGFGLFFLASFARVLGENGHVPLLLAIWTPPVASILLAIGILLNLEDG